MGCDMVVVPGWDAVDGHTLFGHNAGRPVGEVQVVRHEAGRCHVPGEKLKLSGCELLQAAHTYTVLGSQPAGLWGYNHGVNEHGVAAGASLIHSKLGCDHPGLSGQEVVRLVLERSHSASQGVNLITDLVCRHGLGNLSQHASEGSCGNAIVVADQREAFVIEGAGTYWACREVKNARGVSDLCTIRQDWSRLAPGLAQHVIEKGWWPDDGSKIDFAGSVSSNPKGHEHGLQRWQRTSHLLDQQRGRIDRAFLRHLLADHYEGTDDEVDLQAAGTQPVALCQHNSAARKWSTAVSMIANLDMNPGRLSHVWFAYGPPCTSIYFPAFTDGEMPESLSARLGQSTRGLISGMGWDQECWNIANEELGRLQAQFDQQTEEFAAEKAVLKKERNLTELQRQIGLFQEHLLERFESTLARIQPSVSRSGPAALVGG